MKNFIQFLESHDEIRIIDTPLDIELEIPHLAYLEVKKKDSKALLFTNPIHRIETDNKESTPNNISFNMPVLMNIFGSQKRLELIATHYNCNSKFDTLESIATSIKNILNPTIPKGFGAKINKLKEFFNMRYIFPKTYKGTPICQSKIFLNESVDLFSLPILKTWEEDGGRFITMGQVYTRSIDGEANNVGMYRLQVHSKNELLMHWQIHKDATHFFHEYKKANIPMPVSIAIGGDPLYIWCAQAPMPPKVFELMLYGLIRGKNPYLAKCISNDLSIPNDCDIVIEGYVDVNKFAPEGKFGDHTGFYTPIEPYPIMKVNAITTKNNPIYLATVVGKPPLEDKYMGYMTERVFLPLLKTSASSLIDYAMPENGVFHNLIIAKVETNYPAQSLQMMHTFFGIGQMSFVKHAIFLNKDAPSIHNNYKILCDYILDRVSVKQLFTTIGNCDALDHACIDYAVSGKIGIDASGNKIDFYFETIDEYELLNKIKNISQEIESIHIYKHENPIIICGVNKYNTNMLEYAKKIHDELRQYSNFFIFVDNNNVLSNYYMLIWRVVNSIDISRDLKIINTCAFLDATSKTAIDGYYKEWPKDTLCSKNVLDRLKEKGLLKDIDDEFYKQFGIL